LTLDALLRPGSLAVVGASPANDPAVTVIANLVRLGWPGRIWPVHPAARPVCRLPAYPGLDRLPGPVDAAALVVGPARVPAAAEAAVAAGARGLWVFGGDEPSVHAALAGLAGRAGVAVGGPNCMGVICPPERFACWIGTVTPALRPGRVAAVVQSGAVGEALVGLGGRVGWRAIVTVGNELAVDAAAVADRLLDDDLACLALFLEGFRRPAAFVAMAGRAAERGVPVVAVKVGRSPAGRAGVLAHTGALAGEDRVVDAVLRQLGVHRAADLDELVEFAVAAEAGLRPPGRRAFVVTNSGGEGNLLADLLDEAGLELPAPPAAVAAELAAAVPAAHAANPLDLWGTGEPAAVFPAGLAAAARSGADLLVLGLDLQAGVGADERAFVRHTVTAACAAAASSGTPTAVVSFVGSGEAEPGLAELARPAGVPLLRGARPAARALAARAGPPPGRWPGAAPGAPPGVDPARVAQLVAGHPGGALDEVDAAALLAAAGVPVAPGALVTSAEAAQAAAARLGGTVVVKVVAAGLPHKSDAGAVLVGVAATDAGAAYGRVVAAARAARPGLAVRGALVQPHLAGVELLAGAARDPQFGPVVTVGLGGVLAEALDDVALRVAPVGQADGLAMLAELRAAAVLAGVRGRPPVDRAAVAGALVALAGLLLAEPRVLEAEANPLLATPAGAAAVDALVILGPRLEEP
jgi:acetate---CoA ligase (ADP-forming)